jgi:hypothetical protein
VSGYVRLHRDLLAHPAFRNDAEALAFAWLFARAAWRETRVRYKGHAVSLKRGQLAVSIRDMADALDRDKAWIERLFKRLRAETMIETVAEAGVSVITICNYDKYQPQGDSDKAEGETPRETDARQTRDTEQGREEGKEEKVVARKRAPRTPEFEIPDWVPAEPWAAFVAMRIRKRAPVDSYIAKQTFDKLALWRGEGWDVGKVLDKATVMNWTTPYKPTPGRDDELRGSSSAPSGKKWTPEEQAAYLADLAARTAEPAPKPPPDVPRQSTGPRPLGQIVQRIQDQAA